MYACQPLFQLFERWFPPCQAILKCIVLILTLLTLFPINTLVFKWYVVPAVQVFLTIICSTVIQRHNFFSFQIFFLMVQFS